MATWPDMQIHEAGKDAFEATLPGAIESIDASIQDKLSAAKAGLTAAMMAVAEACGVVPEAVDPLEAHVAEESSSIVEAIFSAAVQEVRKDSRAKDVAENARHKAEVAKQSELSEQESARFRTATLRPANARRRR
jgi:hypothetical protein